MSRMYVAGRWLLLGVSALSLMGCQRSSSPTNTTSKSEKQAAPMSTSEQEHDHSQWWCVEHEVPEEECGLCNPRLAAEMVRRGDWCQQHNRPDSQCFECHPDYRERFAEKYRARYGQNPPTPPRRS